MKIFLSYAREDEARVTEIYDALLREGHDPWMDVRNLVAGEHWQERIASEIEHCDMFLIFLSPHSVSKRGTIQREIKAALDKAQENLPGDIFIVPVRLDPCAAPGALAKWHWIDALRADWLPRLREAIAKAEQQRSIAETSPTGIQPAIAAGQGSRQGLGQGLEKGLGQGSPETAGKGASRVFWVRPRWIAAAVLLTMLAGLAVLAGPGWYGRLSPARDEEGCGRHVSFGCIQRGEVTGTAFTDIQALSCRKEFVYPSSEPALNWKNIWTTSVYSYAPGGGGPGGGKEDDVLKVGGWGDWYFSLIQFDAQAGPFAFGVPRFVALLLYAKSDKLGPVAMFLDRIDAPWGGHENDRLWWKDQPQAAADQNVQLPAPRQSSWYFVDITTLYQDWLRKKYPNHGLRLRPISNFATVNYFVSSLGAEADRTPRLVVCW